MNADIDVPPTSKRFKDGLAKTTACLNDVHAATIFLQERDLTLVKGRDIVEQLLDEVNNNRDNNDSHWFGNNFGQDYMPSDSDKRPSHVFAM